VGVPSYNAEIQRDPNEGRVWRIVSHSPLRSLWGLQGYTSKDLSKRVGKSLMDDRIFDRAAELGFYFFFSLFPALFCAASAFGIALRSAHHVYGKLLGYLALVIPHSAMGMVMHTFNQITAHASSGKITFGLVGAIWSASVGMSAIQDSLNDVYKIPDSRSYLGGRLHAIFLTVVVTVMITVALACMFGSDFVAGYFGNHTNALLAFFASIGIRILGWAAATALLILTFAAIYYWAPDWRKRRWRWVTPGGTIGIAGWLIASIGLRVYLYYFNNYALTYGSLGAVIILLTWFYITGLMLLVGGEINSEIEAAAIERRLQAAAWNRRMRQASPNAAA